MQIPNNDAPYEEAEVTVLSSSSLDSSVALLDSNMGGSTTWVDTRSSLRRIVSDTMIQASIANVVYVNDVDDNGGVWSYVFDVVALATASTIDPPAQEGSIIGMTVYAEPITNSSALTFTPVSEQYCAQSPPANGTESTGTADSLLVTLFGTIVGLFPNTAVLSTLINTFQLVKMLAATSGAKYSRKWLWNDACESACVRERIRVGVAYGKSASFRIGATLITSGGTASTTYVASYTVNVSIAAPGQGASDALARHSAVLGQGSLGSIVTSLGDVSEQEALTLLSNTGLKDYIDGELAACGSILDGAESSLLPENVESAVSAKYEALEKAKTALGQGDDGVNEARYILLEGL